MILLQNPNIPVAVDPIEIDAVIQDLQTKFDANISWLSHPYGRVYRNVDSTTGGTLFFPEAYLGVQNGSYRYVKLTPDNDKIGQCLFYVLSETVGQYQAGQNNLLTFNVAILFSVNMKLLNESLLATDYYQQNLISQIRDFLTRKNLGTSYNLVIDNVQHRFEQVFAEFDVENTKGIDLSPLTHFRINCTIQTREQCPAPDLLPVQANPPLTNQALWLKSDVGVNGGGAIDDNDFVYLWDDQSGNTRHFSQLTFNSQPQYRTNQSGGKPAIYFNFDNLVLQNTQMFTGQDFTMYSVSQQLVQDQQNGCVYAISTNGFTTGPNRFYLRLGKQGSVTPRFSTLGANEISLGPLNANINIDHAVRSGSSIEGFRNNISQGNINYGNVLSDLKHYIGNWNNNRLIGYVFEIIIYDVAHTPAEQEQTYNYLKAKYNL